MEFFYFHSDKDEPLSKDMLFEMPDIAGAEWAAVEYLVAAARDKIGAARDCLELVCFLKNIEGKPLTRVSLVVQIEPL